MSLRHRTSAAIVVSFAAPPLRLGAAHRTSETTDSFINLALIEGVGVHELGLKDFGDRLADR